MQHLMHHNGRDYKESASQAARWAKGQLEAKIDKGRDQAAAVIQRIEREVPADALVKGRALMFDGHVDDRESGDPMGLLVRFAGDDGQTAPMTIHPHALQQMCARTDGKAQGFPYRFAQWLQQPGREGWGTELLARNLHDIYQHEGSRYLTRSYGGQLRGFLSDHYRIYPSQQLVSSFAEVCQTTGLVPISAHATDVRFEMKALLPVVFEPAADEVVCFGVKWHNSDYGAGAHALQLFMLRLVCTNFLIAGKGLRNVHLGKRLEEGMVFSQDTYNLDTRTLQSAIKDIVTKFTEPETIEAYCDAIKTAHEEEVNVDAYLERLKKKLTKSRLEEIRDAYRSADVVNMPPGNTLWRLGNAISWVAGQSESVDDKLELEEVAGSVLPKVAA